MTGRPSPWSREEVEATVSAYLDMLVRELAGRDYNKRRRRRELQALLNGRTETTLHIPTAVLVP